MRKTRGTVLALLLCGQLLTACGGEESDERQALSERSITGRIEPPKGSEITPQEISRAGSGTVEQAFLQLWSNLQYGAVDLAVNTYSPQLRRAIGTDVIAEALKARLPFYRSRKPNIRSSRTVGGRTNLRYLVAADDSTVKTTSITWRKIRGRWQIVYDVELDPAIQQSIQSATQTALDPTAQTPNKQAIQAGFNASRLQSDYLEQLLGASPSSDGEDTSGSAADDQD